MKQEIRKNEINKDRIGKNEKQKDGIGGYKYLTTFKKSYQCQNL